MKIKLAILDSDENYLRRLVSVFNTKFSDRLQVYSFTETEMALNNLRKEKIDVFLSSDAFEIDVDKLPARCGFAYFIERSGVDSINSHPAIFKFQKAELIYRQILSIYSEKSAYMSGSKMNEDGGKIIIFSSPCGGSGTSITAAACAMHMAMKGKKVFYLNLETFGTSDLYFSSEGQFGLSNVIYALKSRKANLGMKLESCVRSDSSGVVYFAGANYSLDLLELKPAEIRQMILELKNSASYEYIIIDISFGLDKDKITMYEDAENIVWVSDGTENANYKLTRAYEAISTMEQGADWEISGKLNIIYNKYGSSQNLTLDNIDINDIGGAPLFNAANCRGVVEQMSKFGMFDQLE